MSWINPKDQMPEDREIVIALYLGCWSGRGNSGITDAYAVDRQWGNIPEGVTVVGWMPLPNKDALPEWLATSFDDHALVDLCKERMNEKSVHANLDDDEYSML
ncbi:MULTISPECIES: DUF551 domain-containing protein [Marinobacter]|uniref:DUF551 domain-containing protein n=1 Tax=Marinobacter TaxID=2742 RepID=UPI000AA99307|nr:DUF551 domain-containing protein [Marinobacter sp. LQ44]WBU42679.1 DUF551 domain-containing protein [Marinobacter alkaliphilus]